MYHIVTWEEGRSIHLYIQGLISTIYMGTLNEELLLLVFCIFYITFPFLSSSFNFKFLNNFIYLDLKVC